MYLASTQSSPMTGVRGVPATVVGLGIVSMVTDMSAEMVTAVLPLYLVYGVGVGLVQLGAIDALYIGATAVLRLAGGWAADRLGRPKAVATVGYGLSAVSKLGFPLVGGSLLGIGVVMGVDRVGKGIRVAPRDAMISTAAPAETLGRAFGVHRALDTAGALLGPLLAFALISAVADGFDLVFVTSFCLGVVGVLILVFFVRVPATAPRLPKTAATGPTSAATPPKAAATSPESVGGEAASGELEIVVDSDTKKGADLVSEATTISGAGRSGVRVAQLHDQQVIMNLRVPSPGSSRRITLVVAVFGLLTVGDMLLYVALQRNAGLAPEFLPLLPLGTAVTFMLAAVPMGRIADRYGRWRVFLFGHVLLAAAYLLIGVGVWPLILVLHGLFYAATDGVLMALIGPTIPAQSRATGMGIVQTVQALARAGGAVGFGLMAVAVPQAFLVAGVVLLGWTAGVARSVKQ